MASAGTDGTDLAATLTTAGDVVYKGASALTRLAKGTAAQVLTMNTGATAPEWADAAGGGKVLQILRNSAAGVTSGSRDITADTNFSGNMGNTHCSVTITPTSATSIIQVVASAGCGMAGNTVGIAGIYHGTGTSSVCINFNTTNGYSADAGGMTVVGSFVAGTTSGINVSFRAVGGWTGAAIMLGQRRSGYATQPYGDITVMEVAP
jgi:hypothetical protein